MREALQQFGRSSFGDARTPVDDEVLLQPGRTNSRSLERDADARIAADVPDFLMLGEVSGDELVTVEAHPHARDLRTAIGIQRHEVRKRTGLDQLASAVG